MDLLHFTAVIEDAFTLAAVLIGLHFNLQNPLLYQENPISTSCARG